MSSKIKIIRVVKFAFLGLKISNRPAPYKICLKISNTCNFHCKYCFSRIFHPNYPRKIPVPEMDLKTVNLILDEAWNLGCRLATFGGLGEVTTHKDFYQYLEVAKRMGYIVNFTTNGWIIDPSRLSILEPVDRIRISIDKMHLEGSPDSQKYVSRLSSVIEECIDQNLSIMVVKHGESTPAIDKMLKEIGVRVCNYPLLTTSPAQIQHKRENTFRCIDPWTSISVESDLTINPCSCTSECIGSIKTGIPLKEIWFGDDLMNFRKMMSSINPPSICLSCDRTDRDLYGWCEAICKNIPMV
jgi:MoaA/NifB/PqqE/SkfB family radical SAM enzyme